jgi:cytochrome P450
MQCYTTQRDPTAFPNPDAFVPERWLEAKSITGEMKTLFMPFSTGSRACLGKNLAMMELKLITATLVKNFTIQQAPETTEDCMVMKDHFLALPKGGKCNLIFSRVG